LRATPTARRLAALLSAAPVITLPVMRLIRAAMLPESSPLPVAEVFLSFNSSSPALYRLGERREECARIDDSGSNQNRQAKLLDGRSRMRR